MKVLKKEVLVQRKQVSHMRSERTILEAVNHPFMVAVCVRLTQLLFYILFHMLWTTLLSVASSLYHYILISPILGQSSIRFSNQD